MQAGRGLTSGNTPHPPRLTGACSNTVTPGYARSLSEA
jgi:hypothetical protein